MADVITLDEIEQLKEIVENVNENVQNIKNNTAINNVSSKTGELSQKLSYIIEQNESHGSVEYSTAGTHEWTCPNGIYQVIVIAVGGSGGGGGGGGGTGALNKTSWYMVAATGGGSGGCGGKIVAMTDVTPGTTYTLTVGSGGAGGVGGPAQASTSSSSVPPYGQNPIDGTNHGTNGKNGGDTKFGDLIVMPGGTGGAGGTGGKTNYLESSVETKGSLGGRCNNDVKNRLIFVLEKVSGLDGNTSQSASAVSGKYSQNGYYLSGLSGATGVNGPFNFTSGSGGNGGSAGYQKATGGTNGSAGHGGYIKIIW